MSDIVTFPKSPILPMTKEDANERIQQVRTEFADEVLGDVTQALFNQIALYGFPMEEEGSHYKDATFVTLALQALLYRHVGLEHFLHQTIDNSLEIEPVLDSKTETEDGVEIGLSD